MDESKLEQIYQVIQRRYEQGYRDGQNAALGELAGKLDAKFPREPKPRRARRAETRPRRKNPIETLAEAVTTALTNLVVNQPDGVEPAAITDYLRDTLGIDADLPQTRVTLRHLTLSGAVLRIARGRYLPGQPATPTSVAAE